MKFSITRAAGALLLLGAHTANAKLAFAHFMVSNAENYTLADWTYDITLALSAHVYAFALNTAYDQGDESQYELAFDAANRAGFALFFSFDYAGNGAWPKASVLEVLDKYSGNDVYYNYNGQPFVSTFEGSDNAEDWIDIKAATGCYFVPDWSSLGAEAAVEKAGGVADALFSWAAWPWGAQDMNTFVDASYISYLSGKPYMMPVSPWFYTNLPGYDKNWLWRGDDLWNDRWEQVLYIQPEWVEIISWNDYGESHYIGPVYDNAIGALTVGQAPFDYVTDYPHDGWRKLLPFYIDMYTNNQTTIYEELVVAWYRPQPATACGTGDTTGNTASQFQIEFQPYDVAQDRIFFSAILGSKASVSVTVGGVALDASWTTTPDGNSTAGRYHGSAAFGKNVGEVVVTVSRSGSKIAQVTGKDISTECFGDDALANWNAWVGYDLSSDTISVEPSSMDGLVCTNGTSVTAFEGLCSFACSYGYCPLGACQCTRMGEQLKKPDPSGVVGYPVASLNDNYDGLCTFDCNLGYCPEGTCTTVSAALTTPTASPFNPPNCAGGTGSDPFSGLCSYACAYGFCPIQICSCTVQKYYNIDLPDPVSGLTGTVGDGYKDWGLCSFACSRGYCPEPCVLSNSTDSGGSSGGTPVSVDPSIWNTVSTIPTVSCVPPCVLILPPYTLPTPTTLNFPPITTTWTEMCNQRSSTTTVVTLTFDPITTDQIPVFNINITASGVDGVTYDITPSILPSTSTTINLACPVTSQLTDVSGSITSTSVSTSTTGFVVYVTSTPVSTNTYPTITDSKYPTKVVVSNTQPVAPTGTTKNGGWECEIFCSTCGILGCSGICPLCGVGTCIGLGCGTDGGGTSENPTGCIGPGCSTGGDPSSTDCAEPTTATICTEIVSSTAVLTTPTTSWSTTTRTHCETEIGCDVTGATTTTTMTTSGTPDPTADVTGWTEIWYDYDDTEDQDAFDAFAADYSSYEATFDGTAHASPTTTSTAASATGSHSIDLYLKFNNNEIVDEENGWNTRITVDGTEVCGISTTDSAVKQWTDPSCTSGYSLTIVLNSDDYSGDASFWLDGVVAWN
ncbi:hypothetical protein VM1G_07944 [Cytospora mali]|uniref:Mutanase Pc12g07500 n=1 Tax=Cytospora mali TaxID=578113 RepID=A0A194W7S2_CYTMA|nr:hypothetical protein VM1G_07944 [Valsa mali]